MEANRGADQAAEQRVRGARRQSEKPGRQVPDDSADKTGEHDQQQILPTDRAEVDDTFGYRRGDLDGQERTDQVQDRGKCDRNFGLECTGRDGGGHCVTRVVKTIREIEREGGDNYHQEDYELCGHNVNCAYRTRKSTANGMRTGPPWSTSPRVGCGAAVRDVFSATKSEPCVGPHFLVSLTGKAHSDRFKR